MASRVLIIVLLVISLIFTGVVISGRINYESKATNIHFLMDFDDICFLLDDGGSRDAITQELLASGIKDVVIKEATIKGLLNSGENLYATFASNIVHDTSLREKFYQSTHDLFAVGFEETDFVILTEDKDLLDQLQQGVSERYHFKSYYYLPKGIVLKSSEFHNIDKTPRDANALNGRKAIDNYKNRIFSVMLETPLYFEEEKILQAKQLGFHPVLALSSYDISTKYLDSFEKTLSYVNRAYDEPLVYASEILIEGRLLGKSVSEETKERIEGYLANSSRSLGIITTSQVSKPLSRFELSLFHDFDNVVPYVVAPLPIDDASKLEDFSQTLVKKVKENHTRGFYFRIPKYLGDHYETGKIKEIIEAVENEAAANGFEISKLIVPVKYRNISELEVLGISLGIVVLIYMYLTIFFSIESESRTLILLGILLLDIIGFGVYSSLYRIGLIHLLLIMLPSISFLMICEFLRQEIARREFKKTSSVLKTSFLGFGSMMVMMGLMGLYISALSTSKENLLHIGAIHVTRFHVVIAFVIFLLTYMRSFGYFRKNDDIVESRIYLMDIKKVLGHHVSVYQWLGIIMVYVLIRFFILSMTKDVGMFSVDGELVAVNLAVIKPIWTMLGFAAIFIEIYLVNRKVSSFRFPLLLVTFLMLIAYFTVFSANQPMVVLGGWLLSITTVMLPIGIISVAFTSLSIRLANRLK